MQFLALDVSGTPRRWISQEDAITYHAKRQVAWEFGENEYTFRGGLQKDGTQSLITTKSVLAITGKGFEVKNRREVILSNRTLFGRDKYTCAYCLRTLPSHILSRDHIVPSSKGGQDTWMNVVTACKSCNHSKGNRMLDDWGGKLHYVPYVPNHAEAMILANRNILADQMQFLISSVPKHSRIFDENWFTK